ncbi:MAG: ATP-dependent Clp protease proteolytic subunit [Planctomycetota bacterium]|nr:ATP-dependent Clp protease proteolytic subunit [Planctomycetota bacterium]
MMTLWQRLNELNGRGARALRAAVRLVALMCAVLLVGLADAGASTESASRAESAASVSAGSSGAGPMAVPAARHAANLAVITIEGEINAVTAHSVKRRMARAVDGGADGIVFDLNTPGGEVGAVLEICTAIKQSPIANTIAWVNPTAYSGGAIIALACREIVLAPHATMGDAAPVSGNPVQFAQGLQATERQKILAPLLAELVDSARLRGYDEKLVQGFVTLGVELWRVRDRQTGRMYFVDEAEYRAIFDEEPRRGRPYVASGAASAGPVAAGEAAEGEEPDARASSSDSGSRGEEEGASATAFNSASPAIAEQTERDVDFILTTPSTRPVFSAAERGRYELVEYATDGQTLLTLKESDLKRYGFADPAHTIATDAELKSFTGATNLSRLDQSWSESLVAFMTMGFSGLVVRGVLIVVFLMAMFIEMSMPGVGLPGMIALGALAGLIVPPLLIGASAWWAMAMILSGVALILMELFILPGLGIPGVLGLLLLFAGLIGTFAGAGQLFPGVGPDGAGGPLAWAVSVVCLSVFVAGVGVYLFTRYTHKFPVAGRLVLADQQVVSDEDAPTMLGAMNPSTGRERVAVGALGRTTTVLRPSGTAEFDDELIDVVAEIGFIDRGVPVRVTSVTEYRVAVEPAGSSDAPATGPSGGTNAAGENLA